jgi:hypothetical protein
MSIDTRRNEKFLPVFGFVKERFYVEYNEGMIMERGRAVFEL